MVLGLVQMQIVWEDKEKNTSFVQKCAEKFSKAVSDDSETALLLFPEMTLTGFSMNVVRTADKNGESLKLAMCLAKKYNISLGIGWVKKEGELCENHYSIATPNKGVVSDYIKIHPFSHSGEDNFFKGGEKLSFCEIGEFKIGTAICYDLRFPEIFQEMSKTAELIIVPANWPKERRNHWNTLLCARAIENQSYVAGINCYGNVNGTEYSGDSGLLTPKGDRLEPVEVFSWAFEDQTIGDLYIYKVKNDVMNIRKGFPVKQDRREDLYAALKKS